MPVYLKKSHIYTVCIRFYKIIRAPAFDIHRIIIIYRLQMLKIISYKIVNIDLFISIL